MEDIKSLSHSKYRCKYHIVFAPKYRRQIIYKKIKADVGKILRELSERKGVRIIEAECCPDHIHMLVEIPPHLSVASFMGYLKSKSSLMIFDKHANLKYKYGNRHFWCRGYYVDTVGKYEGAIRDYIRNQLQDDIANDQLSLKGRSLHRRESKEGIKMPPSRGRPVVKVWLPDFSGLPLGSDHRR